MSSNNGFLQISPSNAYVFTNSSNNDFVIYGINSANQILVGAQSNAYANIAVAASNISLNVAGSTSNSTIKFNTNNGASNALTVLGTGNVGVGVSNTNPQYTMDVAGSINFTNSVKYGGAIAAGSLPMFSAYASATTSLTYNVGTLVGFQTKDYDIGGCYNNTSGSTTLNSLTVPAYSYCPNVAGYYVVIAAGIGCANASAANSYYVEIQRNGTSWAHSIQSTQVGYYIASVTSIVKFNGTGDYVNIYAYNYGSTGASMSGTSLKFQAYFIANI